MKLGVCYYPEQWPESMWSADADAIAAMGIEVVRLGEFAWSRIEPKRDCFSWEWLDQAIDVLANRGLRMVLGTPTACPPKWLVDEHPDILARDELGHARRFGSRRHYCFSSAQYRLESRRIVTAMVKRYGAHPAVIAWQTDNEYGCHDTILSYSDPAAAAFRAWLKKRYVTIGRLNSAWGTVFWSQEYGTFDEIDPPAATVTEANPSHRLDYQRFASGEVVSFNRMQVDIIRQYAPDADVIHNFMGFFTGFDHHAVGLDLDVSAWDSYPLGFLERGRFEEDDKLAYLRQGHPDFAAFHHDLYRGCSSGRMWVMEQQPGPVNWAPFNPAPLPGMVRTWTWEAFAHGAEVVSYFRWRQAPFAQEQMHAGLNLPNGEEDVAAQEVLAVAGELKRIKINGETRPQVALVFSYESDWITRIQPQGESFSSLILSYTCYTALRELGLDIDIVSPAASLDGYALVVCPCLPFISETLMDSLARLKVPLLLGPRSGSKTEDFQIPENLPPGDLNALVPLSITRVESLRPGVCEKVLFRDREFTIQHWLEWIQTDLEPVAATLDGKGVWFSHSTVHYLSVWPGKELLREVILSVCEQAGLNTEILPEGVRTRTLGDIRFVFNYNNHEIRLHEQVDRKFELGGPHIAPGGLAAYRVSR